jgi:hypothetical protein
MSEGSFVVDVAIILGAALPLLFLGKLLKVPEVISYLVTGILIGPYALGWIREMGRVKEIAELGVALILFFIGLHVPFDKLRTLGRSTLISGSLQLALTVLIVVLIGIPLGAGIRRTAFYGILIAPVDRGRASHPVDRATRWGARSCAAFPRRPRSSRTSRSSRRCRSCRRSPGKSAPCPAFYACRRGNRGRHPAHPRGARHRSAPLP